MSNALPAREPSMDEILASIRKIIETGDERVAPYRKSSSAPQVSAPEDLRKDPERVEHQSSGDRGADRSLERQSPEIRAVPDTVGLAAASEEEVSVSVARLRAVSLVAGREEGREPAADSNLQARGEPSEAAEQVHLTALVAADEQAEDDRDEDFLAEFDEDDFTNELLARVDSVAVPEPEELSTPHRPANDMTAAIPSVREATLPSSPEAMDDAGLALPQEDADGPFDRSLSAFVGAASLGDDHVEPARAEGPAASVDPAGKEEPGIAIHELVSSDVSRLVGASFEDLAVAVRDEQRRTMAETVQTMLRPMLQDWLDENLPYLVEKLVREEIERIARGPR